MFTYNKHKQQVKSGSDTLNKTKGGKNHDRLIIEDINNNTKGNVSFPPTVNSDCYQQKDY
jgi:hypothetical protein